ncbi:MAG: YqgE/AlgH family protein [Acidimicrobiales bacterium]
MSLRGRLLVAEPMLADPNFHRSVVYLIDHGAEGALGVVLNRPSDIEVGDVVPSWAPYVSEPRTVFVGGPVSPEAAICLGRCADAGDSPLWNSLSDEVGVVDLNGDPLLAPSGITGLRVFAGYSGWSPGQLEAEMAMDGWFVLEAQPGDLFVETADELWRRVLARQSGPVRRFASSPEDPSVN